MQGIKISYRNAKGQIRFVDPLSVPLDVPPDAPAEVKVAAEAMASALTYGPPIPAEPALVAQSMSVCQQEGQKRGRGRPTGYKCSAETKDRMRAAKLAMWQEIKATMGEVRPDSEWSN